MADDAGGRQRDFVLAPNEYLFVQDRTKGGLQVQTGPTTGTLQAGSEPVTYDPKSRRFVQTGDVSKATQQFPAAPEGSYIELQNPSTEAKYDHPELSGATNFTTKLDIGRKINIPGPQTFALWPGQIATVLPGLNLRTNQYSVVRVYNDEAARANWKSAVSRPAGPPPTNLGATGTQGEGGQGPEVSPPPPPLPPSVTEVPPDLTMGKLLVIKGTDLSFYIPPTGLEVVPDEAGNFVREAVTLERLEYCILLSEDGNKRYVKGPAVVFPEPTETFITTSDGNRKFRAIELNPDMGLYIKVTADYEEGETHHKAGDELFITGKEQRLYFPRAEHALIKYGDREIHYGVAIPDGEARYVLDKGSGEVKLVRGPRIFLPDPRTEVIVRKVLSDEEVNLLYPGNARAKEYNTTLRAAAKDRGTQPLDETSARAILGRSALRTDRSVSLDYTAEAFSADTIDRGKSYTPPRTITLDTKYEGAVSINIWNGYAVMIADKAGHQRVEIGPKTVLLEYDEYPVVLSLSTGKPKTTDSPVRTVYLRVQYNHITDIVSVITGDDVHASVKLVWRVNFEGEPSSWFSVENYVKFLCDRTRSILRGVVKKLTIQELNEEYIPVIRDAILGAKLEGKERSGLKLTENGVRVYDVEVSELVIGDAEISALLQKVQVESVKRAITLSQQARQYEDTLLSEDLKRKTTEAVAETEEYAANLKLRKTEVEEGIKRKDAAVKADTAKIVANLEEERIAREVQLGTVRHDLAKATEGQRAEITALQQQAETEIVNARLAREKAESDQSIEFNTKEQELRLEELKADTAAAVERFKSISPEFTAALQAFGNRDIAIKLAEAVAPIAAREGLSVSDALVRIFKGTSLEDVIKSLSSALPSE
jgi:major vault protein